MIYKYKAKRGPAEVVEGTITASDQKEAILALEEKGLVPINVDPIDTKAEEPVKTAGHVKTPKVKTAHVTVFTRQLSSLLRSGVPILGAIEIIKEQSESQGLKTILSDIYSGIKEGSTFSSMLSKYPRVFPDIYVAIIRAGEDGGALPEALIRISGYRTRQEEVLSKIRMAAAYPVLMAAVGVGTVVFMLTFVMPRLMEVFAGTGQVLPAPTLALIAVSEALRKHWILITGIAAAFFLAFKHQAGTEKGRIMMSSVKMSLPVLGSFTVKAELARFCRTMEVLLKNGISILKATDIAIPVMDNELLREQIRKSYKVLEQGGSFGASLKGAKFFPPFVSNLIMVGEESGKLDEALGEVADFYEKETDEAIKIMSSLMEPLMILVIGGIVGFIVIAMMLPIFDISPTG